MGLPLQPPNAQDKQTHRRTDRKPDSQTEGQTDRRTQMTDGVYCDLNVHQNFFTFYCILS